MPKAVTEGDNKLCRLETETKAGRWDDGEPITGMGTLDAQGIKPSNVSHITCLLNMV